MESVAEELRDELEARGEYVVRANAKSGWFAVFPQTWQGRTTEAVRQGRQGPNLVVYRTTSSDARDHYVIPNTVLRPLLVESTLTHSAVNGTTRWNLTLKNDQLHVTHLKETVDVSQYHGETLIVERSREWTAPDEIPASLTFREGLAQQVVVNRYERDPKARSACLAHYGPSCIVCGFNFGEVFGPIAEGYIHIHHLKALAEIGEEYTVDPISDLRPVCPNCHAFIHLGAETRCIDEVKRLLAENARH